MKYFREHPTCPCGKPSAGVLFGRRNESYGAFCKKCAAKRIKADERMEKAAKNLEGATP